MTSDASASSDPTATLTCRGGPKVSGSKCLYGLLCCDLASLTLASKGEIISKERKASFSLGVSSALLVIE